MGSFMLLCKNRNYMNLNERIPELIIIQMYRLVVSSNLQQMLPAFMHFVFGGNPETFFTHRSFNQSSVLLEQSVIETK